MKKEVSLGLLSFALTAAVMTGCDKSLEGDSSPNEGKDVYVRMDLSSFTSSTRVIENPIGDGKALTLNKFKIVFLTTNGSITKVVDVPDTENGYTLADLKGPGITFTELDDKTASVEIVANTAFPALTPQTGDNWSEYVHTADFIKAGPLGQQSLSDPGKGISIVQIQNEGLVNIYGAKGLTLSAAATESSRAKYTANVPLAPTVSRVEVADIKAAGHIASMDIEAVFMDRFYKRAYVTGEFVSGQLKSVSSNPLNYTYDGKAPDYPSYANGYTFQQVGMSVTPQGIAAALNGKVMANYFFAAPYQAGVDGGSFDFTNGTGGSDYPSFVFKITNVVMNESSYDVHGKKMEDLGAGETGTDATGGTDSMGRKPGDAGYVDTPDGYVDTPDSSLQDDEKEIYEADRLKYERDENGTPRIWWATLSAATWNGGKDINSVVSGYVFYASLLSIDETNLHPAPNSNTIDVEVTIRPITWSKVEVTPIFE